MDKAFLLLARDFSPYSDEVIQLLVTPFSPLKSKGKLITFESSNPYKTNYSMDVFTLGEYAIKAAIEVGRKIKTLNTTEVDSGIAEAYKRALSDWSQHQNLPQKPFAYQKLASYQPRKAQTKSSCSGSLSKAK